MGEASGRRGAASKAVGARLPFGTVHGDGLPRNGQGGRQQDGEEPGAISTEVVEKLLLSAANVAACIGASKQRKALLERVVAGQGFAELRLFVQGSAAVKEAVGRGLVAFSNRMVAGALAYCFEISVYCKSTV